MHVQARTTRGLLAAAESTGGGDAVSGKGGGATGGIAWLGFGAAGGIRGVVEGKEAESEEKEAERGEGEDEAGGVPWKVADDERQRAEVRRQGWG